MFWLPFFLQAAAAGIRAGAALFFYAIFFKAKQARELTPKAAALLLVSFKKKGVKNKAGTTARIKAS